MTISSEDESLQHIIVAPHVDDELIGCFATILHGPRPEKASVKVVYIEGAEFTTVRAAEAVEACRRFNACMATLDLGESDMVRRLNQLVQPGWTRFYLPSRLDSHPFHRKVTNILLPAIRKLSEATVRFYSTDMNTPGRTTLPPNIAALKKSYALGLYRSQIRYFEENAAATLFENVQRYDTVFTTRILADNFSHFGGGDGLTEVHLKSLGPLSEAEKALFWEVLDDNLSRFRLRSLDNIMEDTLNAVSRTLFENPLISVIVKNERTTMECNV